MKTGISMFLACCALVSIAAATPAADQPPSSARGDQYQMATAKTHSLHARDHARLLNKYAAASDEPVPASVIQKHLAAIRENTEQARKTYAKLSDATKNDATIKQRLTEISARLNNVNSLVDQLEKRSQQEAVESKMVIAQTNDIAKEIKASNEASSEVDQAVADAAEQNENFYNRQAPNYYFTGEGHFID